MKNKKKSKTIFRFLTLYAFICLSVCACSNEDENFSSDNTNKVSLRDLTGKWECMSGEPYEYNGGNPITDWKGAFYKGVKIWFQENGTCRFAEYDSDNGIYEFTDDPYFHYSKYLLNKDSLIIILYGGTTRYVGRVHIETDPDWAYMKRMTYVYKEQSWDVENNHMNLETVRTFTSTFVTIDLPK